MTTSHIPHPLFRLGFRPLFLFGSLSAALMIGWWTLYWTSLGAGHVFEWSPVGGAIWWHAHEMVFGFTTAIIGGFLLTAVRNWTGVPTITGLPLAVLVLFWLAGRLVIAFGSGLNSTVILLVDQLYLVALMVAVGQPIIKAKMWRNLMFVPILLLMAGLNGLSHGSHLGSEWAVYSMSAIHSGLLLVCLIIAIIGGRVLPFFTANGLKMKKVESIDVLDLISIVSLLLLVGLSLFGLQSFDSNFIGGLAVLSGVANLIRFARWQFWLTGKVSLLWSLHLFYGMLPLGLIALGLERLNVIDGFSPVIHILTVGAIGGMILSMITRVSLGHTGRPLVPSRAMVSAFLILLIGLLFRSLLPLVLPEQVYSAVLYSGMCWTLAFGMFFVKQGAFLWTARPDGKVS